MNDLILKQRTDFSARPFDWSRGQTDAGTKQSNKADNLDASNPPQGEFTANNAARFTG